MARMPNGKFGASGCIFLEMFSTDAIKDNMYFVQHLQERHTLDPVDLYSDNCD